MANNVRAEPIRFNIDMGNFRAFIQEIRTWAATEGEAKPRFSHGRPVLPYEPKNISRDSRYADLVLTAKDNRGVERTLTARIRKHDLYIVGYKMDGAANFLEFEWKPPAQYIPGSTSLRFGENYSNLGELQNLPQVGYSTLKQAILDLATADNEQANLRRPGVRALAVMIAEMTRFELLFQMVAIKMEDKTGSRDIKFEEWMADLIRSWGDISALLLDEDQNITKSFRLPKTSKLNSDNVAKKIEAAWLQIDPKLDKKDVNIKSAAGAAKSVAILKGLRLPPLALFAASTTPRGIVAANADIRGKGLAMFEIFSVRINNIGGKDNHGKLYGTIQVVDGLGSIPLYTLKAGDSEPIQANDIATLQGPSRCISACGFFQLSLDLKSKATFLSDDQVSLGSFAWDLCELTNNQYYDKRLTYVVAGKNGSATVYYTPFSDAVQARVEVMLVHGDGPADVYGSLVARYNFDYSTDEQKKYYRTRIFNKPSNGHISVKPGKLIPLSRSVVAVPTTSSLIIEADLWDYNVGGSNNEIAKGVAEFPPQLDGNSTRDIKGKHGQIKVTVTWSPQVSD